jgi:hypothetical protein
MPALSERRKDRLARRQRHGAVTTVEAVAVLVFEVWFFFFAHYTFAQ